MTMSKQRHNANKFALISGTKLVSSSIKHLLRYLSNQVGCPPLRGDNPRALASGLSYVQFEKHSITILYPLHCTSRDIHDKVGKGGIKIVQTIVAYPVC